MTGETKQQQLEWRRYQVLSLASEGYSQREIAHKLQVNVSAISRDTIFLKQWAKEDLQKHIHDTVPEEYAKCMLGMKRNLRQTLEIADTVSDPRTKLQARAIATDIYKYIMDLVTNGVVITDAMNYVIQKSEQVNSLQKLDERMEAMHEEEEEEETTTNGIF